VNSKSAVRRTVVTIAIAGLSATTLSACFAPPGIGSDSVNWQAVSYTDFINNSEEYAKVASEIRDPAVIYSTAGAETWDSGAEFIEAQCAEDPSSDLVSLLEGLGSATCTDYLALPADIQASWVSAGLKVEEIDPGGLTIEQQVAATATECSGEEAQDYFFYGLLGVISAAGEQEQLAAENAMYPYSTTWTTTSKLGYKVDIKVQLGAELPYGVTTHPANDDITIGSGCGFDITKDIAYPARLLTTNASDSAAPTQAAVQLSQSRAGSAAQSVTTGYIDSGDYCSGANGALGASLNIHESDVVEPGESFGIIFFVIIKDFYSPRYPEGADAELVNYKLRASNYVGTQLSDPIVELTPTTAELALVP